MIVNSYVLQDRTVPVNQYTLRITNGSLQWTLGAASAQAEPIFQDQVNPSNYWRLFISGGSLGWEVVLGTSENDHRAGRFR